jgi:hypothetical protein
MHRPKHLLQPIEVDDIADFSAGMLGREASMSGWMPILRGHDEITAIHHSIGHRDHLIPGGHGKCAAGEEIILDIDED